MKMPQQALTLLEGVLVTVICNGSLLDRVKAQYLWIRCIVAAANKIDAEHKQKGATFMYIFMVKIQWN